MSIFKLSVPIFKQGLGIKELCVYAYLWSIHATEQTLEYQGFVHVKQSTIGVNCGISSVQTDKKIMDNSFDLAIGKIPFGSTKMLDPDIPQSKRWMLSTLPNCDTPSVLTVVHKTDSPPNGLTIPLFLWCIVKGISRNQIFFEKVAIGAEKSASKHHNK